MKVTRRGAAAGAVAAAVVLALSIPAGSAGATGGAGGKHTPAQNLRSLAAEVHLRVGTAVDMNALANDTTYRQRIATEFSSVTAENVMKWETIEPVRGQLDFTAADELVDFARSNHQAVRGHTLLWHNQLPAWLTSGVADGSIQPDELRGILRQHIIDEVGHFRGKIYQWDVVNEVIDDSGNLRNTMWLQQLGEGYIADAFRWAHQADPDAKLFLNDYNLEFRSPKVDRYLQLARDLLDQGVPVDGLGAQGHFDIQYGAPSAFTIAGILREFEALGLETAITEADVRMDLPADNIKRDAQAQGYSALMQGCLLAKKCRSFTVWGYTDKYSWVPGFFTGQGAANLLDENFNAKPAYNELLAILTLAGEKHR
jgi:endo-1,4-beta-xylanase